MLIEYVYDKLGIPFWSASIGKDNDNGIDARMRLIVGNLRVNIGIWYRFDQGRMLS